MILEKFLGNSLKKVTTVGESGEIPHFCYLGLSMQKNCKIIKCAFSKKSYNFLKWDGFVKL